MAKIFMSFYNGMFNISAPEQMTCFYESLVNGLSGGGNDLLIFQDNKFGVDFHGKIPKDILASIKQFSPDLVILPNNYFWDLSKDFDCPIVILESDSFLYFSNKWDIRKNPSRYKVLVGQDASIDEMNNAFGIPKSAFHFVGYFSAVKAEALPQERNISFIGSKFLWHNGPMSFNLFMQKSPSEDEAEQYRKLLEHLEKNPYLTKDELFKVCGVRAEKIMSSFNHQELIFNLSDSNRIRTLSAVADLGLDLYGTKNWISDLVYEPELTLSYKNKRVFSLKHNQDIYNSSKIGININHIQAQTGFSWRVCDIMASNACLVSEFKQDLAKLFPGVDLPLFHDRYEARELCKKLLADDDTRRGIVGECQKIIDEKYRFSHYLASIENFLNMKLHSNEKTGSVSYIFPPKPVEHSRMRKLISKITPEKIKTLYRRWR